MTWPLGSVPHASIALPMARLFSNSQEMSIRPLPDPAWESWNSRARRPPWRSTNVQARLAVASASSRRPGVTRLTCTSLMLPWDVFILRSRSISTARLCCSMMAGVSAPRSRNRSDWNSPSVEAASTNAPYVSALSNSAEKAHVFEASPADIAAPSLTSCAPRRSYSLVTSTACAKKSSYRPGTTLPMTEFKMVMADSPLLDDLPVVESAPLRLSRPPASRSARHNHDPPDYGIHGRCL